MVKDKDGDFIMKEGKIENYNSNEEYIFLILKDINYKNITSYVDKLENNIDIIKNLNKINKEIEQKIESIQKITLNIKSIVFAF